MVSALVCTRNRPDCIGTAIRSLLTGNEPELELIVIDQSDDDATEKIVASLAVDRRLRYERSRTRGKGAALNQGLRLARGTIVVCTDDDCEAPHGWATAMARALESQPSAAIAFCNVIAPPYDHNAGYVPAYERRQSRLLRWIGETIAGHGLGAGMALRRQAVLDMGGFDESLGPGSRFPSGDDWDITGRALLRGWHVYETADLAILHNGFRSYAEGRAHARRDWVAIGAVCAKPLRAGHLSAVVVPVWEFSARALWPPVADVLRLRRPRGLARITGFVQGFVEGWRTPVDRETLRYVPPS
jgi:glycosyltransferase involved in cell wall biosynthesis